MSRRNRMRLVAMNGVAHPGARPVNREAPKVYRRDRIAWRIANAVLNIIGTDEYVRRLYANHVYGATCRVAHACPGMKSPLVHGGWKGSVHIALREYDARELAGFLSGTNMRMSIGDRYLLSAQIVSALPDEDEDTREPDDGLEESR